MPITIRTIAPESVGMVTVATLPHNSPVRCVDLSIGFETFMDTENFHFSHCKEICMILFPFHADTPCEPHYSSHGEE